MSDLNAGRCGAYASVYKELPIKSNQMMNIYLFSGADGNSNANQIKCQPTNYDVLFLLAVKRNH